MKKKTEKYQPSVIEPKWQERWEKEGLYQPNLDKAKKPFYNLMMFPYPSAEGMHVGNMYAFTGSDIYGRFKRLQGFDVFEPIGLDGFGIHSENYAIKVGRHPSEQAKISQKNFYRQLRASGNGFDWSRRLETYDPNYYKWTQWIFIRLFKAGLAYRKKAPVNFCPSCKTVLADEQVINKSNIKDQRSNIQEGVGVCERCETPVERKELEQWFFRITNYADRLLNGLAKIDWSEKVKIAQRNWIGKKEGIVIQYRITGSQDQVECWTSRPDTNFGATFIVLAPEHPFVLKITSPENKKKVENYIKIAQSKSQQERIAEGREKSGVFTGRYVINDLTGEPMPIWVSDFVLMEFGTGTVVGVPGHDRRDFEFAQKFGLPIKRVVVGVDGDTSVITKIEQVQEKEGKMINSGFLDGMDIHQATKKIMDYLEEKGWGKRKTTYHLRDWLISRQRYWGPPIPIIYCRKCWELKIKNEKLKMIEGRDYVKIEGKEYTIVPVSEEELPVLLPNVKDWKPKGSGVSPLATVEEFVKTKCPRCGGQARRETDVSDTFLDSAWYFFRYISTDVKEYPLHVERIKKWLPVNMYIGGAEHSVLHLLYTRFLTMVFKDLGLIDFDEPFKRFRAHGLIIAEGAKMSKSKGNVVVPDEYIKKYGADTLRMYLMFLAPFTDGGDFRDAAIEGIPRFLKKAWQKVLTIDNRKATETEKRVLNKTIKKVTDDIESLHYNTAISTLMELLNFISGQGHADQATIKTFLILLAPFAPHITEELFFKINTDQNQRISADNQWKSIHQQMWPSYDPKYLTEEEVIITVQVNGKLRDTLRLRSGQECKVQSYVEEKARESEKVSKHLKGKSVKRVVYVEGRIINFVTSV